MEIELDVEEEKKAHKRTYKEKCEFLNYDPNNIISKTMLPDNGNRGRSLVGGVVSIPSARRRRKYE